MGFKSTIIKSIAKALGTPIALSDEADDHHHHAVAARAGRDDLAINSSGFTKRLKEVLKEAKPLSDCGLQIIGLSNLRDHYGEDWPGAKEKILNISRRVIEANLEQHDIYATFYDIYFVVMFGDLSLESAQAKSALIVKQISNKVFGDSSRIKMFDISTATLNKNGNVELHKVNFDDDLANTIRTKDATYLQDVAWPNEEREKNDASVDSDKKPEVDEPDWEVIQRCEQGPDAKIPKDEYAEFLRLQLPQRERKLYNFGRLNYAFRPMWLVKDRVTSAMSCIPSRVSSDGTMRVGGAALLSSPGSPVNAEYDITTINKVMEVLLALEETGDSAIFIAPVHFITVAEQRYSKAYLETIRKIPARFRKKILFELIAIPSGTPSGKITNAASALRLFVDHLLVRVRLEERNLSAFLGLGVYAVGADITNFNVTERKLIELIDNFSESAKKLGFKTYIHGLRSRSLITAAICAGVDFVDGDPVNSVTSEPLKNHHFDLEELYNPVREKM